MLKCLGTTRDAPGQDHFRGSIHAEAGCATAKQDDVAGRVRTADGALAAIMWFYRIGGTHHTAGG
jgi:hypothetical protein